MTKSASAAERTIAPDIIADKCCRVHALFATKQRTGKRFAEMAARLVRAADTQPRSQ